MPLTRLANAIIDGVADSPGPVAAEIAKYLASDLLFYRAGGPQQLRERQAQYWDPILAWAREALGAQFKLGDGIVHVAQPEAALRAARAALPGDPWRLGAVHAVTTLTGSALIALALLRDALTADAAWQAAHVDEDWNMEQWGKRRDGAGAPRVPLSGVSSRGGGTQDVARVERSETRERPSSFNAAPGCRWCSIRATLAPPDLQDHRNRSLRRGR